MLRAILTTTMALIWAVWLPAADKKVRPVRDAVGFCWQADETDRLCGFLQARLNQAVIRKIPQPVLAGIVPHDDYLYAGEVSYRLFSRVEASEVLIIGVTHGTVRKAINNPEGVLILDSYSHWHGPYGPVAVSPLRERLKSGLAAGSWLESDQAHSLEHSIEALIPLLQKDRPDLTITPVMVTAMPEPRMAVLAAELARLVRVYLAETGKRPGHDFAVLISADGNHYGKDFDNLKFGAGRIAHQAAVACDHALLDELTAGTLNRQRVQTLCSRLWGSDYRGNGQVLWCGKYSIPFGLLLSLELYAGSELEPVQLGYADTFSRGVLPFHDSDLGITAPFSLEHWVSFFSLAFY